jgi:hypothetical protein
MYKFILIGITILLLIMGFSFPNTFLSYYHSKYVSKNLDSSTVNKYCWLNQYSIKNNLVNRVPVPEGYQRIIVDQGSFGDWLRHLPLKEKGAEVHLYNGILKARQDVHEAVIDIDAGGSEDLQQCADACMRLKAEFHFSRQEHSKIHFKFTSGDNAGWMQWMNGYRPTLHGNKVSWSKTAKVDSTYKNLKNYLKTIFQYAGTQSLSQELLLVKNEAIQPGDIFIKGGFPGHAIMVVDVAEHKKTKAKVFLLVQSYMPAQEIHLLKNFSNSGLSPWYKYDSTKDFTTAEWEFEGPCLKRFSKE